MVGARNSRLLTFVAVGLALAAGVGLVAWNCGGSGSSESVVPSSPPAVEGVSGPSVTVRPATTPTTVPVTPDFAAADGLLREGRYNEARDAFRVVAAAAAGGEPRAAALVGRASASVALGDQKDALAALTDAVASVPGGSPVEVRARYLLLRELRLAGRLEEAAAVYASGTAIVWVSPLGLYFGGEGAAALGELGRFAEADELWRRLLADPRGSSVFRADVYRQQARVAADQGDFRRQAGALEKLVVESGDAAVRLELAELWGRLGDVSGMVSALKLLVAEYPASPSAGVALTKLVGMDIAVDPGQAGLVYYRRGLYAQAKAVLVPAVETPGLSAADVAFRAYFLGAAYEDSGQAELAVRYYDLASASGATSVYVHRARYWAARVVESLGRASDASERYRALVRSGATGEFTQESAFRAGYVWLRAGDVDRALSVWGESESAASARLEYWRGRAWAVRGDGLASAAAFRRAIVLDPYDFYALEAGRVLGTVPAVDAQYKERDLKQTVDWLVVEQWLRGRVGGGPFVRDATAACGLMSVGLRGPAAAELWAAASSANAWGLLSVLREAHECGVTDVAAQLGVALRVAAGVRSGEAPPDLLRVSYPVDFVETFRLAAKAAGVDPLFYAALIRQESLWDPGAGSTAGALGLTQVIPPTGFAIAAELGVVDFSPEDLFRPAVSLEFGAYYFGMQLKSYGSPWLALSAYNAGPANAARWKAAGANGAAEFLEVVDFVETRTYVKYILEAYAHYQLAWGD